MALDEEISRRTMLKVAGLSVAALGASKAVGDLCSNTPQQPEGPFYPVTDQLDKNTDLTIIEGKTDLALGDIIYLSGTVRDENCDPLEKTVVEIWQACAAGRYNHPDDTENPNSLDPNFQYWGIALTNESGNYQFKTVIPGHYLAGPGWIRPPHVHFKVRKYGYKELITQMYFSGNQYNADDRILRRIPVNAQPDVVRALTPRASENGRNTYNISFDITLEKTPGQGLTKGA